jgi:hypothetical protein
VSSRFARRCAVLASVLFASIVATAGPVLAHVKPDDGEVPGPSLGTGMTIVLFVIIPLGAFLLIAGLALLPSALSRPRYRPGKPWDHEPRWIGRPAEPVSPAGPTARGGASAEW